jgi:hypothetical protein
LSPARDLLFCAKHLLVAAIGGRVRAIPTRLPLWEPHVQFCRMQT